MLYKEEDTAALSSRHMTVISIMVQLVNSLPQNFCNFGDLLLGSFPVATIDCIPDTGEECLVIT